MRCRSKNDQSVPIIGSVLLVVFLITYLIFPTQIYGSNVSCDPSVSLTNQTTCGEKSSSSANSESMDELPSNDIETPLILPDISPTREDLDNTERDDSMDPLDSDNIESNDETDSGNDEVS